MWTRFGVGEPKAIDRLISDLITLLEHFSIALSCNGKMRELGKGSNVLGNPLAAIAHLMDVLMKQPQYKFL